MAKHLETGKKGEALAVNFLQKNGFDILETNWRFRKLEVDIIAKEKDVLVFVEVKTRSTDFFGHPEEFVDPVKEKHLAKAAAEYMALIKHDWAIRFDVVAIVLKNHNEWDLKHIKDAFFPGLE
ncbi:MAG: YraN family protein [Saprospiraceae bacterium]